MKRQARLILVCFGLISGLVAYFSFSATREDLDPLKVAPETHKLVFENALVYGFTLLPQFLEVSLESSNSFNGA